MGGDKNSEGQNSAEPGAGSQPVDRDRQPPGGLIVGIGASAGGLEAFSELLRYLPPTTGMAFVLVQHLDPHHESILADLLKNWTQMPVVQVQSGAHVEPDHVYVIPPNATLLLVDRTLRVVQPKEQHSYQRRPIDAFFASLADNMHGRAIGVVLSGAASDGTLGLKAIKAEGGITFAQDATAKFDGMPRSAIAAGYVDFVLPPRRIAQELATIARHPLAKAPEQLLESYPAMDKILSLLHKRSGVDFSQYKMPTIQRRLARRMVVAKAETPDKYLDLLYRDPKEVDALFEDLLIKVTEFFRDPAVFDALKRTVFPLITANRAKGEALRIWVPGCSTGEEVYSLVISLLEYLETEDNPLNVQVFGTDASDRVIEKARAGIYDDSGVSALGPERLRRFFIRTDSGYQINREVRDMCIFSRHNLRTDPPLSRMDLISCRNLLIYFAPALQQKVIDTLAYALRPSGCLLIGPSENTGRLSELFNPLDQEHRIYTKKSGLSGPGLEFLTSGAGPAETGPAPPLQFAGADSGSLLLSFEDITERKRAAEARYRRLFDSARDGIIIVDATTGEVLDMNPYMERLFGYSREELVGKALPETAFAADNPLLRAVLEQIRDEGVAQFTDMELKSKDGRTIQTEFVGNVYDEGSRKAIQLNLRDLTERRKFERELQHTQKLESLGLLAGGIAHDFNNLLTGVLGNASLAYSELRSGSPLRPRLRAIITAAERASDLTRQLLAYAGKGRFILEQVDLSSLVREILVLIQSSIPKTVDLVLDLADDLPPVETDASQMQQLIMNLVINGAEAIGERNSGRVEISTAIREVSEEDVRERFATEGLRPGPYVALQVKDSGAGMDEATKAKIFDPFFTTKFTGRGLGLAAVAGIVRAHQGAIRVYSTPGHGSSFLVLLPAAESGVRVRPVKRPRKWGRRTGTVLVIDDEKVTRDAASAILENHGFKVLLADDGREGVDIFREHGKMISLVIVDLTMPEMGGEQAFDLLRAIRRDVPIVLASGYDEREMAERSAGKEFAGFLHKPFDVDTLLEVVDSALGRRLDQ